MVYPSKRKYDAENVIRVTVAFNRNTEPELYKRMQEVGNRAKYIKGLIRSDVERGEERNEKE